MEAGTNGTWWPSSASSKHSSGLAAPSAYIFYFKATTVYLLDGPTVRWGGFPLRGLDGREVFILVGILETSRLAIFIYFGIMKLFHALVVELVDTLP